MSKRVLIVLAVGLVLIIGAFFLLKYEKDQELKLYDELEPEPEPKPKVNKTKKANDEQPKQTEQPGAETGAGTDNPGNDEGKE